MKNEPVITLLMAAYNGEKYIEAQIESIINQTFGNWKLVIRDDGSTDRTVELVKKYIRKHDRITLIINQRDQHGAVTNFAALFDLANKDVETAYFMFCDQDDIWLPQKIDVTLQKMQETEAVYPGKPVLVYGNLQMMSENGQDLDQNIQLLPRLYFKRTLVQNFAFGCTMMFNMPLSRLVNKIPRNAVNHDHWVALVAAAFGHEAFLSAPLIKYRQHQHNVTSQGAGLHNRLVRYTKGFEDQVLNYRRQMNMLATFFNDFGTRLDANNRQVLADFLEGYLAGRWQMLYQVFKHKIFRLSFFQNLGMIYTIIFFYSRFKQLHPQKLKPLV